jgi:DNA polymerase-3 subunit epsilon
VIGVPRRSRAWREASFAVLDFETTGLDADRDHVLSFGLVPVESGRVVMRAAVYRVVHPPLPVPAESIRVHGIRPSDLRDAPALDEVVDELVDGLRRRELVAYAAAIELAFLERLSARHAGLRVRRAIDVLDLASALAGRGGGSTSLTQRLPTLADEFGVPVARTHHALGDALTTAQLFLVLATRLEALGAGRLSDLRRAGGSHFAKRFWRTSP